VRDDGRSNAGQFVIKKETLDTFKRMMDNTRKAGHDTFGKDIQAMARAEHIKKSGGGAKSPDFSNVPLWMNEAILDMPIWKDADVVSSVDSKDGDDLATFVSKKITDRAKKIVGGKQISDFNVLSEIGNPTEVILDVIKREKADLVVLGSRGLGNVKGMLMGSVSHKVAQLAPCTCITVK